MKKLNVIVFLVLYPTLGFSIDWSWSLNNGGGTFTASEADSSTSLSGNFTRLGNGFLEMTTTSGSGASYPGNGTKIFPVEVPGFFLAVPPVLGDESQMSFNVTSGTCPSSTVKYNWTFQGWTGANNMSSANQGAFGEFTWNDSAQSAAINSIYSVSSYAYPSWFTGDIGLTIATCSGGAASTSYVTPGTDRSGQVYLSEEGGMVYKTDSNRLIFGVPQVSIPSQAIFYDTYTAYISRYDTSGTVSENLKPIRLSIAADGTAGSGQVMTDIATSTTDGSYGTVSLAIDAINDPAIGMFRGTLSRNANNAKVICVSHFTSRTVIFCAGQAEDVNSMPSNLVLVSDTTKLARIDHSFGSGGVTVQDFNGLGDFDGFEAVAEDSSSRLIAAGHQYSQASSNDNSLVVRFLENGSLDTSFGSGGIFEFDWAGSDGGYESTEDILVQSDGKIVGAGFYNATSYDALGSGSSAGIFRLDENGVLDTTFGTGGKVELYSSDGAGQFDCVAQDAQGRIIAGGNYGVSGSSDSLLARFNSDGSLDSTFATGGMFVQDFGEGGVEVMFDCFVDSNNKILLTGTATMGGNGDWTLVRFHSDGSMDTSFGTGGRVSQPGYRFSNQAWSVNEDCQEDSDQKIVCVGYSDRTSTKNNMVASRFLPNGNLDTSFGSNGNVLFELSSQDDRFYKVVEAPNRKYIVFGYRDQQAYQVTGRLHNNGTLDTSFGSDGTGWINRQVGTNLSNSQSGLIDSRGRIIAVGEAYDVSDWGNGYVLRYFP